MIDIIAMVVFTGFAVLYLALWRAYGGWFLMATAIVSASGAGVAANRLNSSAGCLFAPKVVQFYQGMTLCPGQSAITHIELHIRPRGEDI